MTLKGWWHGAKFLCLDYFIRFINNDIREKFGKICPFIYDAFESLYMRKPDKLRRMNKFGQKLQTSIKYIHD